MDEQVVAGQEIPETPETLETRREIEAFAARYPFPLDPFQVEAIAHLAQEQSVMVAAPTGTGKTLVAEYAIWRAQRRQQRVIYTTPLKALSNQKYRDLRELYGYDAVGLVTGDIVEHSRASIVIMTTEVYRNMLLEEGGERFAEGKNVIPSSLADVGYVVFDELHYLSDPGRGPVWEEAIICSPLHVRLVGLSATVSNAEDLANWISRVHRPISLVMHEERAVPLEHYYFLDNKLHLIMDANGNRVERFPKVGGEAKLAQMRGRGRVYTFEDEDDEDLWEEPRKKRRGRFIAPTADLSASAPPPPPASTSAEAQDEQKVSVVPGQGRGRRGEVGGTLAVALGREREAPTPGEVLTALRDADLLPCLYFLPGRRVV